MKERHHCLVRETETQHSLDPGRTVLKDLPAHVQSTDLNSSICGFKLLTTTVPPRTLTDASRLMLEINKAVCRCIFYNAHTF